ncbi:substrate-binding domain-containing protein [Oricola thermophila]|uniref:Substrate-binding domain-containing protein n=1 Tax=Oricola thermophila TaxID=2742145 RepID=A0A6N1VDG3_9HYPH|nr:substrate-binding domain-containing protein [Oricola thermophila]QKV19041.1 substrate-binding domain-containing protein [Oricola thermophila]
MKNRMATWAVAGFVAAAVAIAGQPAQAFDQGDLIKPIEGKLTFVFIPKVIHPWYEVVKAGAATAAEEFAAQGVEIDVIWDELPQADVADHNRRIETNIGRRPDGLAVSCLDPSTNVQLLGEAVEAGTNVITFDTFCSDDFKFVGHKNDAKDGADLAAFLAEKIGDEGKVGILAGSLTAANHAARVQGFKDEMARHPGIEIVFEQPDDDDLEKAVSLTENALQANPDIKGIFGSNASNPIGAARAVVNAGKTDQVTIVGMDDLPETLQFIEDGVIAGVKAQRQWEIGYWAVKYLVAMNQNHTTPQEHATGSQILTKELLTQ